MAPVLRKRKEKAVEEKSAPDAEVKVKKAKVSKTEKRKAPEDASPIPVKKQKSAKAAAAVPEKKNKKDEEEKEDVKPAKEKKTTKKSTPKKKVVEEEEPAQEELEQEEPLASPGDDAEEEREVDEQTQALARTFDSEDEDAPEKSENAYKKGQDVGKIPKTVKKLPKKKEAGEPTDPGVIYLGRIPHGFAEQEMRAYFGQFGEVTRLRLARNKKTGRSKHFAFIEFADKEVAEIVAKTMDRYLLFGHILRCRMCPKDQLHPDLFKGANRRFKTVPWNKMAGRHLEKPAGESDWQNRISKEQRRRSARAEKLKEIMDYEFESPALKEAKAQTVAVENGAEEEAPKAIEAPPAKEQVEAEGKTEEEVVEKKAAADEPKKAKSGKKAAKAKKVKS